MGGEGRREERDDERESGRGWEGAGGGGHFTRELGRRAHDHSAGMQSRQQITHTIVNLICKPLGLGTATSSRAEEISLLSSGRISNFQLSNLLGKYALLQSFDIAWP